MKYVIHVGITGLQISLIIPSLLPVIFAFVAPALNLSVISPYVSSDTYLQARSAVLRSRSLAPTLRHDHRTADKAFSFDVTSWLTVVAVKHSSAQADDFSMSKILIFSTNPLMPAETYSLLSGLVQRVVDSHTAGATILP
jgi:hypothetical protein